MSKDCKCGDMQLWLARGSSQKVKEVNVTPHVPVLPLPFFSYGTVVSSHAELGDG